MPLFDGALATRISDDAGALLGCHCLSGYDSIHGSGRCGVLAQETPATAFSRPASCPTMLPRSDVMHANSSAWRASFSEAVREAGIPAEVTDTALQRLSAALLARHAFAQPRLLTSSRQVCPDCSSPLYQPSMASKRDPKATGWILAEPRAFQVTHVPRWCKHCQQGQKSEVGPSQACRRRVTLYWCGFMMRPVVGTLRRYTKVLDASYLHEDFWLVNKSFGVSVSWLRQWRYRLFLQRVSFQSEATLFQMMHGSGVPASARFLLSECWVRYMLWHRAHGMDCRQALSLVLLSAPVERLIATCWKWYCPLMQGRRDEQWRATGDRQDVLAIDGNAKLHRRTCGMPFAETVWCETLGMYLLRGCPDRPCGQDTLCKRHCQARDVQPAEGRNKVIAHRLVRALQKQNGLHLEVQLEGFRKQWQPACTVPQDEVARYFASGSHDRVQERRKRRLAFRKMRVGDRKRPRKEPTFMASWSSRKPREQSECGTHKESEAQVTGAARTAGFLTAVSASGIIVDIDDFWLE